MKKQLLSMAMLMAMSLSASAQQLLPYQNPNLSTIESAYKKCLREE